MNHPLQEYLEVYSDSNGAWIRCTRCSHILCRSDEEWKEACKRVLLPPTEAGPLYEDLRGKFLLQQLLCPSCGVLLNTQFVEEPAQ